MTNMAQVDPKTAAERIKAQQAEARVMMLDKARRLAGLGLTLVQISAAFGKGSSWASAMKHRDPEFALALEEGAAVAIASVANALYINATQRNNVTAQMFFLKCRGGWRDEQYVHADISGAVSVRDMSDAELEALAKGAPDNDPGGGE